MIKNTFGFTDPRPLFKEALEKKQAIGAFNVYNLETLQAATQAAMECEFPILVQASTSAIKFAGLDMLVAMLSVTAQKSKTPLVLHLDHGPDFETCKACIDAGFSSVMIDGSAFDYDENVALTKRVVDYAHSKGVAVEAELGQLKGVEDDVVAEHSTYTDPKQALDFIVKTGCDSLAVSIGTSHGAYKFAGSAQLDLDRLSAIKKEVETALGHAYPLVLHGASSVSKDWIMRAEKVGAQLGDAQGVPETILAKAAEMGIAKINVDTDLRLTMTTIIREYMAANPKNIDPRAYLKVARDEMKEIVKHKIKLFKGN